MWSSELYLSSSNWVTIEKDFTQEEIQKINVWYSYNIETWEFEETEESKAFAQKQKLLKVDEIKQKYSSIILAKYSLTDQLNMTNEALMINTLANMEWREFTDSEKLRFQEIKQAKVFIDEQRGLCQKEIETFLKS